MGRKKEQNDKVKLAKPQNGEAGLPSYLQAAEVPEDLLPEQDPELRTVPRARLLQRTSKDIGEYQPGYLVNSLTGELLWPRPEHENPPDWVPEDFLIDPGRDNRAGWVVVPLDAYTERVYFEGLQLACRSDRMGRHPLPGFAQSAIGECALCELKDWKTGSDGSRIPPKCNKAIVLIVVDYFHLRELLSGGYAGDLASAAPVALSFVRTSFKAGAFVYRLLTLSRPKIPPFARRFVVWPEEVKGDLGTYYLLRTSQAGWVEEREFGVLAELARLLREVRVEVAEALPSEFAEADNEDVLGDEDIIPQ